MRDGRRVYICRYCYETGHNARTCPKARNDASSGTSYRAQRIVEKSLETKARVASIGRECTYCKGHGHNKVTCQQKSADRYKLISENKKTRTMFVSFCEAHGFSIGTLVNYNGKIGMVTKILPEMIHCQSTSQWNNKPIGINFPKQGVSFLSLPSQFYSQFYSTGNEKRADQYSIVGKVFKMLPCKFDYQWTSGELGVDTLTPTTHIGMPIF